MIMALMLRATLVGRARGQGSMKLIRAAAGHEVAVYGAEVRNYRNLLIHQLREEWGKDRRPISDPVGVEIDIAYPRPASHYLPVNGKRSQPVLKPDAPEWHIGTPDSDKVARLVDDALVGAGVLLDDKQVVSLLVWDRWAEPPGELRVQVWTV